MAAESKQRIDYHRYMASRAWREKRKAVIERSGDWCERCWDAPLQDVHHLTYERLGDEQLEDLQGLCRPCHEFISAESNDDPRLIAVFQMLESKGLVPAFAFGIDEEPLCWNLGPMASGVSFHFTFQTTPAVDNWLDNAEQRTVVIQIARAVWMHGMAY